jgi:quinol monooxygenase YgiN
MTSIAEEEDIKKVVDMGESLPPNKIVGGIKRATVKQGSENEFESLIRELAAKVRENDKGCNYYDLYRSEHPRTYLVMEQYENRDALQRHQKSEHGKYYFPRIRELLENIEVSYYECALPLKSS